MAIMVEFHSLWNLPVALRLARALEPFEPFWFEDPIKADDAEALAVYSRATTVPVAVSETLAGGRAFRNLLERRLNQIVMLDLSWAGGITEAKKIAAMAEAYQLPVTLHDCTGPVVLAASTHLSLSLPNALIQELVRAFYIGWYRELLRALPQIENGTIRPPEGHGLGVELQPGLRERADAVVRVSEA